MVDVGLICDTADFAAQMPDIILVVQLAAYGLGVMTEQAVEYGV